MQATRSYDANKSESFIYFLRHSMRDLWTYRFAFANLVRNAVVQRYRRSLLGVLWSLLNPLLMMLTLTAAFSLIFKQDPLKFAVYIFSGLLCWNLISGSILNGMNALVGAETYLRKMYVPKLLFPLVSIGVELVNWGFSFICYLLVGLLLGLKLGLPLLGLPLALGLTLVFCYGLTLALSVLTVYFRDTAHLASVIIQALFYTLPIMYPIEGIPESSRFWFRLNPFYHYVSLFRNVLYEAQWPSLFEWGITAGISVLSLLLGIGVLKMRDRDLVYRL